MIQLNENLIITICFTIFAYLVYRYARKGILDTLDQKIKDIQRKLIETEQIKKDAEVIFNEMDEKMISFASEEQKLIESAQNATKKFIKHKIHEIELAIQRKEKSAIETINQTQRKCSNQMQLDFTNLTINLVHDYLIEKKDDININNTELLKQFLLSSSKKSLSQKK